MPAKTPAKKVEPVKLLNTIGAVDKTDLAEWIGLSNPALLGTGRVVLTGATIEELRASGPDAELTTTDVGLILGITRQQVTRYTSEEERFVRLNCRRRLGTQILIRAGDLAAFIEAKNTAGPVPPRASDRKRYAKETAQVVADACRRHKLPMPGGLTGWASSVSNPQKNK